MDNPHTLRLLIEQNRPVLAPMMIVPYSTRSNFWGAFDLNQRYVRSIDYNDIVRNKRRYNLYRLSFIANRVARLSLFTIIHKILYIEGCGVYLELPTAIFYEEMLYNYSPVILPLTS